MLTDTEEKRKNELLQKMDFKIITETEFAELRVLTNKAVMHLAYNRVKKVVLGTES